MVRPSVDRLGAAVYRLPWDRLRIWRCRRCGRGRQGCDGPSDRQNLVTLSRGDPCLAAVTPRWRTYLNSRRSSYGSRVEAGFRRQRLGRVLDVSWVRANMELSPPMLASSDQRL